MFSHLRLASRSAPPCPWSSTRLCSRRNISVSVARRTSLAPEPPSEEELAAEAASLEPRQPREEKEATPPANYREFLQAVSEKFKHAAPRNWLGQTSPFPMNPSFRPPAPLSDSLKEMIYQDFMKNPKENSVRALSQRHHLSLKRVDAILRLKGMEHAWMKVQFSKYVIQNQLADHAFQLVFHRRSGKQLQTGFVTGMEKLLGVDTAVRVPLRPEEDTRYDANQADALEEEEQRDAARQRYQRSYWESVPEAGMEPIVPGALEFAMKEGKRLANAERARKSGPKLMPRLKDTDTIKTPRKKVQIVAKEGRPTIHFVDVGGKFLDVDDRLRRMAESERRTQFKQKKAATSGGRP